jgi:hypothetical protein
VAAAPELESISLSETDLGGTAGDLVEIVQKPLLGITVEL